MRGISIAAIFSIALGVYFLAALVPGAMDSFFDADTSNWSAPVAALWVIIPLAIIAAIVFYFIPNRGGD